MQSLVHLPKWDCDSCTPAMKKTRGCGVPGTTATLMGEDRLETCPRFFIRQHPKTFYRLVELHNHYEKGFLPDAGGLGDQSALTMEALQIVAGGLNSARAQKADRRR